MKHIFVLLLASLSLTGCTSYQWVKPGADLHQEDIAETQCKAQALRDLPPNTEITGKYTSFSKKYNTKNTSYSSSDTNASQRRILVKDCMYRNGWTQVETGN
ncbi:lipoprotein [Acetobacter cibinongensis]|uniref:Lipoprotein n=1 Tax=Acetobacter cibinongensis TaxID=146475 RepID=A0A1Z5YTG6_9PROT|nr:lipoprotein [Acetobacter cibinongensis]OUJ01632.1 hypothetical protein HK14_08465 [Acetobacter cibinongensis]GAN59891.1 hypothetical protein Abci_008_024 [Acetobacter cibinongensis]GBQ16273.1 hypothetical protein AA0482_1487 [Acetobacter cibinongensis NRIC 0482]GEL57511.1 hypothetical protein ACI01nite_01130 [Acetobacter cibinongensis]